jgi:hypothetical protein
MAYARLLVEPILKNAIYETLTPRIFVLMFFLKVIYLGKDFIADMDR